MSVLAELFGGLLLFIIFAIGFAVFVGCAIRGAFSFIRGCIGR